MKKSIVISIGLFIFIFLFHWFISEVISIFTIISLIYIYPVILFCILGNLIWSIVLIVRKAKVYKWKAALPLVITAAIPVLSFFPFRKAKVFTEFLLYTKQRENVIEMIEDGTIRAASHRSTTLPFEYRYLSCDGDVYFREIRGDNVLVGFWVYRSLSTAGYSMVFYNSTKEPDIFYSIIEDDISSIIKLNNEWYYVVTD